MRRFDKEGIQLNLRGKVALITGGTRMGEAISSTLANQGVDVIVTYRNSMESALKIQRSVRSYGRQAWIQKCNVARMADVKKIISFIKKDIGRLDILINLASTFQKTDWNDLDESVWHEQMDNNVKGVYTMVLQASALLKKNGGRVINFSDWVAASGRPNYKSFVPYFAAKAAVLGLTQTQALELAPDVLVNAIAPGPIIPPKGATKKEIADVIKATPLKRWGGPDEIAKAVLFLCQTDFMTGECIRVDGGRHLY